MSKTNHRINRDRDERLAESTSHKTRRGFKQQAAELADYYEPELLESLYDDQEYETKEKIRKR